jgi:putative hemolysin
VNTPIPFLLLADADPAPWSPTTIVIVLAMIPLLIISAFFSGSETALFSLSVSDRTRLSRNGSVGARSALTLIGDQRMLLLTILLGNMTANVLYFVLGSVILIGIDGAWAHVGFALVTLLAIVLFGEVFPKLIAARHRCRFAMTISPALLIIHTTILPLRAALEFLILAPLRRLVGARRPPLPLTHDELGALLTHSAAEGVIDAREHQVLDEVLELSSIPVREVMTPRTRMISVKKSAARNEVRAVVQETRLRRLPVHDGDLDTIVGILDTKSFLLEPDEDVTAGDRMRPPMFVPHLATLDQLLEDFRRRGTSLAIAVDEYGGTAGIVAMEDVVEELVGDITEDTSHEIAAPVEMSDGSWQVDGLMSVRTWAEALGHTLPATSAVTLGGWMTSLLGRAAFEGDVITVEHLRLEVVEMDGRRVAAVKISMTGDRR